MFQLRAFIRRCIFDHALALPNKVTSNINMKIAVNTPTANYNILSRSIHFNNMLHHKLYEEGENEYARQLMATASFKYWLIDKSKIKTNKCSYDQFTTQLNSDWTKLNTVEMVEGFSLISEYAGTENIDISDDMFDKCIDALTDTLHKMTDDQLEMVFFSLSKWPSVESVRTRNFIEVWVALDDVLLGRKVNWDPPKLLLFADHFFNMHLTRQAQYTECILNKLTRRYKCLTAPEFVQTLFLVSACRKPHDMHNLELRFKEHYASLTFDEIAIVCMGFFKSKTPIRDGALVVKLMQSIIGEAKVANEISLTAVLKMVRYSIKSQSTRILEIMLDSLVPVIKRVSLLCCVHIGLTGTTSQVFHPVALTAVAQKFVDNPSIARMKDMERLILAMSIYNFDPPTTVPLCDVILSELRNPSREEELETHYKSLINCLAYLCTFKVFPVDLISKVLKNKSNMKSLKNVQKIVDPERSLFMLDKTVEIECENYDGEHLCKKTSKQLANKLCDYMPEDGQSYRLSGPDKIILDLRLCLEKMRGGKEYVIGDHILPHFQKGDLICCNDLNGNPVSIKGVFPPKGFGYVRYPPTSENWITVTIAQRSSYVTNTRQILGPLHVKLRQLTKIGYNSIMISWYDWEQLATEKQKISYLEICFDNLIKHSQIRKTLSSNKNKI